MSLLKENYTKSLLDEILLRYLHRNTVPATSTLVKEYNNLLEGYPTLSRRPLLPSIHTDYDRYEIMRADKYNQLWRRSNKDFSILFQSLTDILKQIHNSNQAWDLYYQRIFSYLERLENRVDNLLLLKNDTLGYFSYATDDFSTSEFIDITNTTAELDTGTGMIYMPQAVGEGAYTKVTLDPATATVSPRVFHKDLISSSLGSGVTNRDIVKDNNKPWYMVLLTKTSLSSITLDAVIDLGEKKTFNTVALDAYQGSSRSSMLVTLFYSADGVDWLKAGDAPTKSIVSKALWNFSQVSARYLRTVVTKSDIDQLTSLGNYSWTVGFNKIELFSNSFITSSSEQASAQFQSIQHTILDSDASPTSFNKVTLQTCEVVPADTDISYSVSVDTVNWIPISNTDRKEAGFPAIVDFGNEQTIYSLHSYSTITSDIDGKTVNMDLTLPDVGHLFSNSDGFVNFTLIEDDFNNLMQGTLAVMRNVGTKNDTLTVRNKPRGWYSPTTDSAIRSCAILIMDPGGVDINFGPNGLLLDNAKVKGPTHISEGIHSIQTSIENWQAISTTNTVDDDNEMAVIDPLFPYNHKLLIEGYKYNNTNTQGVYRGVSVFAEHIAQYIPVYRYNILDTDALDYFTYTLRNKQLVFVCKVDSAISDYTNEKFEFMYRLRNQAFTSISLRAVLSTFNSAKTPLLQDYTIKVG